MKILLVGHGAREHAIAECLVASRHQPRLFAYMAIDNPGLNSLAENKCLGKLDDVENLRCYAERIRPDLVVFGSETPLAAGGVDALANRGFDCIGPFRDLARIESDKSFMREFMLRHVNRGYPTWRILEDPDEVAPYLLKHPDSVLKPIGLTGGKGVKVINRQLANLEEAVEYAKELISRDGRVLVEERLEGEEFSLMVFTDGQRVIPMPLVQDYKYAHEGDTGPMTGGMGSYSQADHRLAFVSEQDYAEALSLVHETIQALGRSLGHPYRGILYGQFIQTPTGPKIVEFNARLGDPEAINVLALLRTDLVEIFHSIVEGELVQEVEFSPLATVCKYLVPQGYPEAPRAGSAFELPKDELTLAGVRVYFASVRQEGNYYFTTSSRSIALLLMAPTPAEAKQSLNALLEKICPPILAYRRDIPRLPEGP